MLIAATYYALRYDIAAISASDIVATCCWRYAITYIVSDTSYYADIATYDDCYAKIRLRSY